MIIKVVFENTNIEKVGFDLKFAIKVLSSQGVVIAGQFV